MQDSRWIGQADDEQGQDGHNHAQIHQDPLPNHRQSAAFEVPLALQSRRSHKLTGVTDRKDDASDENPSLKS